MLKAEFEARSKSVSYSKIAESCGVSVSLVSRVIRGDAKPYPKLRDGIANALGWPQDSAAELFEQVQEVR